MDKSHMHSDTFYGLHKWECYLFQKLGWVAKSLQQGNELKVTAYVDSINRLEMALHNKIARTHCPDRQDDLQCLLNNVDCLKHCSNILFNTSEITKHLKRENDSYKTDCQSGNEHESTFQSLHCWLKAKYEKLGRMCLSRNHGNELYPKAYMQSIKNLKASLEHKLEELTEKDRKEDIKVLINYTCFLQKIAQILLEDSPLHSSSQPSHSSSKKYSSKSSKHHYSVGSSKRHRTRKSH